MVDVHHLPVQYRPVGADKWETPADVCGTCSDFDQGHLVPVSFCPEAAVKSEAYYDHLAGGPTPDWEWESGPDAAREGASQYTERNTS